MSEMLTKAITASAAFDPMLQELCAKKLSLDDLVASAVPPKEKVRIIKGLARNLFKVFEAAPHPVLVEEGLAASPVERRAECLEQMAYLQELFATAYLQAYNMPPPTPLGYYAVRMGADWVEVHKLDAALSPKIQALRDTTQNTNFFG